MSAQLQLELVEGLDAAMLVALHASDKTAGACSARDQLENAGVAELTPVHQLTDAEIRDDRYGFAREFTAILNPDADPASTIDAIRKLSFVKSCAPPGMQSGY